jgi:hypothetical protein
VFPQVIVGHKLRTSTQAFHSSGYFDYIYGTLYPEQANKKQYLPFEHVPEKQPNQRREHVENYNHTFGSTSKLDLNKTELFPYYYAYAAHTHFMMELLSKETEDVNYKDWKESKVKINERLEGLIKGGLNMSPDLINLSSIQGEELKCCTNLDILVTLKAKLKTMDRYFELQMNEQNNFLEHFNNITGKIKN